MRTFRLARALVAPFASALMACTSGAPSPSRGPTACATNAGCPSGQACRAATGGSGFCGNCVQGANFAVHAGPYCLETGWGSNLGDAGRQAGDDCPIGSVGCVVANACTQLLRCDVGDSYGLYACPPGYTCNFEQCVSSNVGPPCPPGSSYLPTSSTCGALIYLQDGGPAGTCILYAPPCDDDAGDQSCPTVLEQDQPIADGYVTGPVEQVCLSDVLTGNGHVCTPLRTCTASSDCTDGLFSTCHYVNPETGGATGTCVNATDSDSGADATGAGGR